ncbi:MAG: hypothetical protein JW860_10540 [Sedimentisphaerales bacterium]|nr:hypothetical protein [Sedimentisphaerales bacterium]
MLSVIVATVVISVLSCKCWSHYANRMAALTTTGTIFYPAQYPAVGQT